MLRASKQIGQRVYSQQVGCAARCIGSGARTTAKKVQSYEDCFEKHIDNLKEEGRYRIFANLRRHCGSFPNATLQDKGYDVKMFCSNDYLGMGQHPKVLDASVKALKEAGVGAGGTRNIGGTTRYHVELEAELAELHQKESALVCSSCYVANLAALGLLGKLLPNCMIISDAGNHASMIEGIRHSVFKYKGTSKVIHKHNDMADLERILKNADPAQPKVIVFESVYSMSGTIGNLHEICRLAKKYNAYTFCDEVHAVGMYGNSGAGVLEQEGLLDQVDIITGTLGKAYGVFGGYLVGSTRFVDCVRSIAPEFIFTTAVPPTVAAGALAAIRHLRHSSVERETQRLRVKELKALLESRGLPVMENPSHIVPVTVGEPTACKALTDALLTKHRVYIQPINYPTVPKGTERIRVTPGPLHTAEDMVYLADAIDHEWTRLSLPRRATAGVQEQARQRIPSVPEAPLTPQIGEKFPNVSEELSWQAQLPRPTSTSLGSKNGAFAAAAVAAGATAAGAAALAPP